jgi:hypothetical protein
LVIHLKSAYGILSHRVISLVIVMKFHFLNFLEHGWHFSKFFVGLNWLGFSFQITGPFTISTVEDAKREFDLIDFKESSFEELQVIDYIRRILNSLSLIL